MLQKDSLIRVVTEGGRVFIGIYRGHYHEGVILHESCVVMGKQDLGGYSFTIRRMNIPWTILHPIQIDPVMEEDPMYAPYKQAMTNLVIPQGSKIIGGRG